MLTPPSPNPTPPVLTFTLNPTYTHVDVHPQYTVGGPVLAQWVPPSHFGLQVEQEFEVIRKPEDQQLITATANNGFKHVYCTIQH